MTRRFSWQSRSITTQIVSVALTNKKKKNLKKKKNPKVASMPAPPLICSIGELANSKLMDETCRHATLDINPRG